MKKTTIAAFAASLLALTGCSSDTNIDAQACGELLKASEQTIDADNTEDILEGFRQSQRTLAHYEDKIEDPTLRQEWVTVSDKGTFLQFTTLDDLEFNMWGLELAFLEVSCENAGYEPAK